MIDPRVTFGWSRHRSDWDEAWVWGRWLWSLHGDGVSLQQKFEEMRVSISLLYVHENVKMRDLCKE